MTDPIIRVSKNVRVQKRRSVGNRIYYGVSGVFLGTCAVLATNNGELLYGMGFAAFGAAFIALACSKYRNLS